VKKIALGIGGAFAVILVGGAAAISMQPSEFQIERKVVVAARPEVVWPLLTDFHQWERWSPWEKVDPEMTKSYEGAPAGVGAIYAWKGNNKVGEGRMTIASANAPSQIDIKLEFMAPWVATNTTTFTLAAEGESTSVVWNMKGKNDFMGKAMSMTMDMDAMVGAYFEKGLASLGSAAAEDEAKKKAEEEAAAKAAAEAAAAAAAADPNAPPAAPATP
jgi:uncharacterized protein YndB with AHSA1/START domain